MSDSQRFNHVVREWAEVFMHRAMHDGMRFAKEAGLTLPQLHTLMRLHHARECGVSEISGELGVTNAAVSQMVERLVQLGLVERGEDPHDRRARPLALTRKGRDLVLQSIEARRRWLGQLTQALDPERQAAIIAALTYLTEAARRLDAEETAKDAKDA